ncbi:phenylalanine--tRNA ligase subunit beta [Candidatus Dojkabacteria bacterium]|uniref:phenylalanine--tRNA ligase n=1 Tax=Candidatus Dojkabacteria bacterium TaxID=2099670 RepID=A0A955L1Y1_9BACT|nr:phenylalanine--tRNA ligase subunit beta [Candidatus Dojkabacteria bacterium]
MKLLHSQLIKYIPSLKISANEVADVFTEIGYMKDGPVEEVTFGGKADYFTDLEVRQNRADCFGVQGLARDLAAYHNLDFVLHEYNLDDSNTDYTLPIEVKNSEAVKRVMAIKIDNVQVGESPDWLKEYLALYDINSINNLVDLTNYVMLETGHPSHAFDADISGDALVWEINPNYKKMVSLDGTKIDLVDEALVVSDGKQPLALAGLVGGDKAAMSMDSKNVIVEMAVYDGGLIRRNSREMKVFTEASSRLEKFMDPDSIDEGFSMLVSMILDICNANIASKVYDNYLQKEEKNIITIDLDKASQIAGVEIEHKDATESLIRLGFDFVENNDPILKVTRPINRLDIQEEEDVYEEIIRMYGYYQLPTDTLNIQVVRDVTPARINLIDNIKSHLTANGFDEVRTWVLVDESSNSKSNFSEFEAISVQNSINDEVPILRQNLTSGLLKQVETYEKKFINQIQIFEVGKVFYNADSLFKEHYALGLCIAGSDSFKALEKEIKRLLSSFGFNNPIFKQAEIVPEFAHPTSCFDIWIEGQKFGVIYKSNSLETSNCSYAEVNIDKLSDDAKEIKSTIELSGKLVSLDSNIILEKSEDINLSVREKLTEDLKENLWSWEVIDEFEDGNKSKYTVRFIYFNLSDQEAKTLHEKVFG